MAAVFWILITFILLLLNPDVIWRYELFGPMFLLFLALWPILMILDDGTTPVDALIVLNHWTTILRTILVFKG